MSSIQANSVTTNREVKFSGTIKDSSKGNAVTDAQRADSAQKAQGGIYHNDRVSVRDMDLPQNRDITNAKDQPRGSYQYRLNPDVKTPVVSHLVSRNVPNDANPSVAIQRLSEDQNPQISGPVKRYIDKKAEYLMQQNPGLDKPTAKQQAFEALVNQASHYSGVDDAAKDLVPGGDILIPLGPDGEIPNDFTINIKSNDDANKAKSREPVNNQGNPDKVSGSTRQTFVDKGGAAGMQIGEKDVMVNGKPYTARYYFVRSGNANAQFKIGQGMDSVVVFTNKTNPNDVLVIKSDRSPDGMKSLDGDARTVLSEMTGIPDSQLKILNANQIPNSEFAQHIPGYPANPGKPDDTFCGPTGSPVTLSRPNNSSQRLYGTPEFKQVFDGPMNKSADQMLAFKTNPPKNVAVSFTEWQREITKGG